MKMLYPITLLLVLSYFSNCKKHNDRGDYSGIEIVKETSLAEHSFDTKYMDSVEQRIINEDFGKLNSLIIIHQDKLIYEKYFGDWGRADLHYIASDTKSFTSLLFGIAKDEGYIGTLDEKITDIFSGFNIQNLDERKEAVTIKHLLTMSAGFEWDEWIPYSNPENSNTQLKASDDWIRYTLNKPMATEPGSQFVYNSGASILLGEIIKIKTGEYIVDYAVNNLFTPLNISRFTWSSKNGVADCGGGLHMRPIDMAKIGYLILKKGKWGNKQIVSEEWINASFNNRIPAVKHINYGYQWWYMEAPLDITGDIGHASGHGDQFIFIVDDLDMVIVLTGENYDNDKKYTTYDLLFELLKTNPDYKQKLFEKANWVKSINASDYDYKDDEYMSIAYDLISYSAYEDAIEVLNKLSEDKNKDNWFYYFLYGSAYYHLSDKENAILHLNKHVQLNQRRNLHEQAYYKLAMQMLEDIND